MAKRGRVSRNGRKTEGISETAQWCRVMCDRCGCERGDHSYRQLRCPDRASQFNDFLSVSFIRITDLQVVG